MLLKSEGDVTATTHDEALREVALSTLDVVLDLVMPGRSGLELLQEFADRGLAPIIVLTATNTVSAAVEAMKRGAADFVTKPFEEALKLKVRDKLEKWDSKTKSNDSATRSRSASSSARWSAAAKRCATCSGRSSGSQRLKRRCS